MNLITTDAAAAGPGCCPAGSLAADAVATAVPTTPVDDAALADPAAFVVVKDGAARLDLMVENLHCAACIGRIERALKADPAVLSARVNMSTRRLTVSWRDGAAEPRALMRSVADLGYPVHPFDPAVVAAAATKEDQRLLSALAVAGFAAGNVMLLSVSVWSGHAGGMGDATRTLFHWISALIALPAVAYAGIPFFKSAVAALRARSLNMDVPISLAVVLAAAMSLHQTMAGAQHAYFDASVTLLFFLLIGRYLDRRARSRARSAAEHLLALQSRAATVVSADGTQQALPLNAVAPGMTVAVAAGERIPVDGTITMGESEVDAALVTGESLPKAAAPSTQVFAGTLNLAQPLRVAVTAAGDDTLLAEIVRLMETAEQGRARYVRIADRIAGFYAPAVHVLAAATFVGWLVLAAAGWQVALMTAIAVLIITCPCALGLAVPAVQVVATGRLLRAGVLVKSADGLERLARADHVVFDKTGTLTLGRPSLIDDGIAVDGDVMAAAAALAAESRHPLSRALVRAADTHGLARPAAADVTEAPGRGLSGTVDRQPARLGSRAWCEIAADDGDDDGTLELWFRRGDDAPVRFAFEDEVRPDAAATVAALERAGLGVELLSGDRPAATARVARALGIGDWRAGCLPADKVGRLEELAAAGKRVLMVGDGLNDAPALAAGFVSLSPAAAADVSQTAADLVFQGASLAAVATAGRVARSADRLVRQNFALAFLYNAIAVPVAVLGLATPLVAAVAMSSSSLVVTLNALRLRWGR